MAEQNCDRLVLALDVGSSSVRCCAYRLGSECDTDVRMAAKIQRLVPLEQSSSSRKFRCVQPTSGKINLFGIRRDESDSEGVSLLDEIDACVDSTLESISRQYEGAANKGAELSVVSYRVVALGFSTFVMNLVGVDEGGVVVGEEASISYACNSTEATEQCRELRRQLGPEGLNKLYQRTGAPLHSAYALPQLRACYDNSKETSVADTSTASRSVHKWQTIASVCLSRWTGRAHLPISYSEASWTGLLDFRTCRWDEEALSLLPEGCRRSLPNLADFTDPEAVAGGIPEYLRDGMENRYWTRWPELRGRAGKPPDSEDGRRHCRLFLGIGDGACANIGSKCSTPSRVAVTIGTSAAARVCLPMAVTKDSPQEQKGKKPGIDNDSGIRVPPGLFCYRVDKSHVLVGGALTDGGSVVEWGSSLLNLSSDEAFNACIESIERLLKEDYERADGTDGMRPETSDSLSVIPFLSGERSTGFRDGARGCVSGITRETTPALFMKACLEGVVLRINAILSLIREAMVLSDRSSNDEDSRNANVRIVASGNALERSKLWRDMLSDCSRMVVELDNDVREGTSRGVARLVAAALAMAEEGIEDSTLVLREEEEIASSTISNPEGRGKADYWKRASIAQDNFIGTMSPLWR